MNKSATKDEFGLPPIENEKPAATIHEALPRIQAEVKSALKASENAAFKAGGKVSKYADLGSVWDAAREPLTKNNCAVIQTTDFDASDVWLITTLYHSSGASISGRYPLRPVKNDPQGFGSALTYARRYTLAALLGVVADEDDDGNAASARNGNGNGATNYGKITAEQAQTIRDMLADSKRDPEKFCQYFRIKAVTELSATDYPRAIEALNTTLHPKGAPRPSAHEH